MAKRKIEKEKLEKESPAESLDLDSFDFESMDFGDFEDDSASRQPSRADLAKDIAKTTGKAMGRRMQKDAVSRVFGNEFETEVDDVLDIAKHTKDLAEESFGEIKDALSEVVPKGVLDFFGMTKKSSMNQRRQSEEQIRDASIQGSLDGIFNKISALDNLKIDLKEELEDGTEMALSKVRNELLLRSTNDGAKLTGFFLGIGNDFFRKSLELQYSTNYTLGDILKSNLSYHKGTVAQFDRLIKNTGLPEHVKITQGERVEGKMKDAIADKIYSTAWTNNAYVNRLKGNITNRIRGFTSSVTDKLSMAQQMQDMGSITNRTGLQTAGDIGASMGGDWLGGRLVNRFRKRLDPIRDNKYVKSIKRAVGLTANDMDTAVSGARGWVNRSKNELENRSGIGAWLGRNILGLADSTLGLADVQGRDTRIKRQGFTNMSDSAFFDQSVHKSITQGIPAYLSRILLTMQDLNEKYSYVNRGAIGKYQTRASRDGEQLFSFKDNKLMGLEGLRRSVNSELQGPANKEGAVVRASNKVVTSALANLKGTDEYKVLDNESNKELLTKYVTEMSSTGNVKMDFDTLFNSATTDKANPHIQEYLKENPQLAKIIKAVQKSATIQDRKVDVAKTLNTDLDSALNSYPTEIIFDLFEKISQLSGAEISSKPTKEQAIIISTMFSRYLLKAPNGITGDPIAMRNIFENYASKEEQEQIEGPMTIFTADLTRIMQMEDPHLSLEVMSAFAPVNKTLRERLNLTGGGVDMEMEQFQGIINNIPQLGEGIKDISADNIMTRSLDKVTKFIPGGLTNFNISKVTPEDLERKGNTLFQNRFFSGIDDRVGNISKAINEAEGGLSAKLKAGITAAYNEGNALVKAQVEKTKTQLKSIASLADELTEETIKTVGKNLAERLVGMSYEMDALKDKITVAHIEKVNQLNSIKVAGMSEQVDDNGAADFAIAQENARYEYEISILTELSEELVRLGLNLDEMASTYTNQTAVRFLKDAKDRTKAALEAFSRMAKNAKKSLHSGAKLIA